MKKRQYNKPMETKIKVAYNTFVQIFGRFFNGLVTYLVTMLMVRQYGPVGFGDFIKILTYISYFYIMADFGANAITVKKMSQDEAGTDRYLSELLGFRLLASVFLIFVSIMLLVFIPQGETQGFTAPVRLGIILGTITILTQSMLTTANAYFQKTLRYDKGVVSAGAGYVVVLCLAYLFVKLNLPVYLMPLAYVLGGAFSVLMAFLFIGRKILPSLNFKNIKELFFASLPLGLILVLNLVYFKADSFILTLTRSTVEVGIYGLAYKFFEIALVFPTFFMNSLYPVMLKNMSETRTGLPVFLKKSGTLLLVVSILMSVAIFYFSPQLINLTAGTKYTDFGGAISALRILSLGLPFFFVSSYLMWLLITEGRQKIMVPIYGVSMIFNIVLNLLFIPGYGFMAAAVITVVSETIIMLLLLIPSWGLITKNTKI